MKNIQYIIIILLIIIKINSQKLNNATIMKFNDIIDEINNKFKTVNYTEIISTLISLLSDYYVFYDIEKSTYGQKFDIIKDLKEVNIINTNFYTFITDVKKIIRKPKDAHLDFYSSILLQYFYFSPIQYYISTENNNNYLKYYTINTTLNNYKNKNEIKKYEGKIIKSINNQDPFDYIENFGKYKIVRDGHGEFSINLRHITNGRLTIYPFSESDFTNINLVFDDNQNLSFDYIFLKSPNQSFINTFYLKVINEMHKFPISFYPIIGFEKYNNYENNNNLLGNKKEKDLWDINYNNQFKYKYDNIEKVNVIYVSTFMYKNTYEPEVYYKNVMEKLSKNKDPIIIILDLNPGGYLGYELFLQKIINYKLSMTKVRLSSRKTENSKNLYDKMFTEIYDINTCTKVNNPDEIIEQDIYNNEIKHNRSKIYSMINTYMFSFYKPSKIIDRNPTDILLFTDGVSISAASFLINDLKESGNAIIVGYNGNPKENKKKDLFMASNSPSFVLNSDSFKDKRCDILKKNNLTITITNLETFNDSYINKTNEILIPREYQKVNIDYRSNIYGGFNDSRYNTFIKEGKKIIEYFKDNCSPNNMNLIKINSSCKFENKYTHGGNGCGNNQKWNYSNCSPSYCDEGYVFDNKNKKCIIDKCYEVGRKSFRNTFIVFILIVLIFGFLLCFYVYKKFITFEKNVSDFNTNLIPTQGI